MVIETFSGASFRDSRGTSFGRTYDWSLESRPYGWGRAMAAASAANAAGLLVGYAVSAAASTLTASLATSPSPSAEPQPTPALDWSCIWDRPSAWGSP